MDRRETIHEWEQLSRDFGEELDAKELASLLDEYTVDFPPEHVIQTAIENSLPYVPTYGWQNFEHVARLKQWLHSLSLQVGYLEKWFWILSLLLFVGGYAYTVLASINPYKTVLVLAPLPFVLGVLEMLRSVDSGMVEMELTSKFSFPQIVMARFVLIGSFNIVLNTVISLGLSWTVGTDLWKVVLFWFVPFTWVSSGMLFLASRFRGIRLVPIAISIWGIAIVGVLSNPKSLPYLLSMNNVLFVLFGMVGVALLRLQARQLRNRMERGIFVKITD